MAALTPQVNNSNPAAYCERLEQFDRKALLAMGLDGSGLQPTTAETTLGLTAGAIAQQALALALDGYVEFTVNAQTETNDTVTSFNLSDKGVDFLTAATYRRVDIECFMTSDADAGLLRRVCVVAGGTTPVVVMTKLKGIEDAATATSEGGIRNSVVAGDFLAASLIVPDVLLEQNTNKIRLSFTGITNIDLFWQIKVRVYPKVAQTFPVTD